MNRGAETRVQFCKRVGVRNHGPVRSNEGSIRRAERRRRDRMRNLANLLYAMITSKSRYVVAIFTATFLWCWYAGAAQVLKGSTPAGTTAAQLHQHLRGARQGQGRTSPMIKNPQAAQLDNSSIIAVCRNQKQNADREVQDIIPMLRAMGDGSHGGTAKPAGANSQQLTISGKQPSNAQGLTISGNQPAANQGAQQLTITGKQPSNAQGLTISGNQPATNKAAAPAGAAARSSAAGGAKSSGPSGNLPAVMSANTKTATGPGGALPQGPMKTESATGPQGPNSPTRANMGGPQILGSPTMANVTGPSCPQPKIQTISGFPMAIFTPVQLFN